MAASMINYKKRGHLSLTFQGQYKVDFQGISFPNNITPTDIDMCLEKEDKIIIFVELKKCSGELHRGQERLLQNLTKYIKIPCFCIHAIGETIEFDLRPNPNLNATQEIMIARYSRVTSCWNNQGREYNFTDQKLGDFIKELWKNYAE